MGKINHNGSNLDFTTENSRFKTDIAKGYSHITGQAHLGSVTVDPIYEDDDGYLFLEHVIEKSNGNSCFWFMWYDENGNNKVNSVSAVIGETDILEVIKNISKISL